MQNSSALTQQGSEDSMAVRQPGGRAPLQIDSCALLRAGLLCAVLICSAVCRSALPFLQMHLRGRHLPCFSSAGEMQSSAFCEKDKFAQGARGAPAWIDRCLHPRFLIGLPSCKGGLQIFSIGSKRDFSDLSEWSCFDIPVKMMMADIGAQLRLDGGSLRPIG